MHEEAIINSILEPIKDKENVKRIEIEVGELAGIEGKHLKEHLAERVDWDIVIIEKKSKIRCLCGYEGEAKVKERLHDQVIYECPKCGLVGPEIVEGGDIKIIKVVYD